MNIPSQTLVRLVQFVVLLAAITSASGAHLSSPNPISVGIRSAIASTNGFGLLSSSPSRAATSVSTKPAQIRKGYSLGIGRAVSVSSNTKRVEREHNGLRQGFSTAAVSSADHKSVEDSIEAFWDEASADNANKVAGPGGRRAGRGRVLFGRNNNNNNRAKDDETIVELCSYASPPKGGKISSSSPSSSTTTSATATVSSGGAATAMAVARRLHFWENMICGAVSRSVAQTIMHPANTMKTILQSQRGEATERLTIAGLAKPANAKLLTRGAGAQFLLSVPHGAVNFAVLEYVRRQMTRVTDQEWLRSRVNVEAFSPGFDFLSSAISTICCSVVSTPQMMITDNIMAGTYPNLPGAIKGLASEKGIKGFYAGWWPGLAGKIPSYALTWTLFQQLKDAHRRTFKRDPKDVENSVMGCLASATTVTVMIPLDTIKTRLVTQLNYPDLVPYKGIIDCGRRIFQEEGMIAFYRGLSPRLVSVVPMIGIQFGVYEFMKKAMLAKEEVRVEAPSMSAKKLKEAQIKAEEREREARMRGIEEVAMEVAADDDQPFPAPHLGKKKWGADRLKKKAK